MTKSELAAVEKFRKSFEGKLEGIRDDVGVIKSDEIVDDNVCDSAVALTRDIANEFNELAKLLGFKSVKVPKELEVSPYQQ